MGTDLQTFVLSRYGVNLALFLSSVLPANLGYRFADIVSRVLPYFQRFPMARAVRVNQWVANGQQLNAKQLTESVRATFRNRLHCLYDLYSHLGSTSRALFRFEISPEAQRVVEQTNRGNDARVLVIPHLGNYDLIGRAMADRGFKAQVLTVPSPSSGYQIENRLRLDGGLEVTPIDRNAIRAAIDRLRSGGSVLTGIDRPVPGSKYRPHFFGHRAEMSVLPVRLALQTGTPVVVIANYRLPGVTYRVDVSEPIVMEPYRDRMTELVENTERVLKVAADFIRMAPYQWGMFYPVWPELMSIINPKTEHQKG